MIGTRTPCLSSSSMMRGTAAAASSLLTVTRTNSDPARASAAHCWTVEGMSAVSVLVMDCTTIGASEPTRTPPTTAVRVFLRGIIAIGSFILTCGVRAHSAIPLLLAAREPTQCGQDVFREAAPLGQQFQLPVNILSCLRRVFPDPRNRYQLYFFVQLENDPVFPAVKTAPSRQRLTQLLGTGRGSFRQLVSQFLRESMADGLGQTLRVFQAVGGELNLVGQLLRPKGLVEGV